MSSRARWAVVATAALTTVLGLAVVWPRVSDGLDTLVRWEPGREYRYRFTYASSDRVGFLGVSEASMTGEFDVAGELVVRAFGTDAGVAQLGVRLEALTKHRYEALGKPIVTTDAEARAALVGPEALVLMEPTGVVRGIELPAKAPALFRNTITALFAQGAFELRAHQPRWDAVQSGPRGEARAQYQVTQAGFRSSTVTKSVTHYDRLLAIPMVASAYEQRVSAPMSIVVARDGKLQALDGAERIEATSGEQTLLRVDARITLALLDVTTFDLGSGDLVAALRTQGALEPPLRLDQPVENPEAKLATLTRIAQGLERQQLIDLLRLVARGQPLPPDFFWRAAGFLELHPEACADLVALFGEAGTISDVREAITTLLVSTGTPEAQASLREVLRSEAAAADPRLPAMITTLSFLGEPVPETLALLEQMDATAQGPTRVAATYALGAEVGSMYRTGDREIALEANRQLVEALKGGAEPSRQRELLTSLGNAGLQENVTAIDALSSSPEPAVRAAVANALRKTQSPESESTLLRLATDASQPVQNAALIALQQFQPRADLLTTLSSRVRAGQVDELSYPTVLNLVGRQQTVRDFPREVRALLEAMLATPIQRTEVREAIEQQLQSVSGA